MSETNTQNAPDMCLAALWWARRGMAVFPLYEAQGTRCACGRPDCYLNADGEMHGSPGKHPRPFNGHKSATTDEHKIREFWRRWPTASIGGAVESLKAWVLDLDGEVGIASMRAWQEEHGALPPTLRVRTGGGGEHWFFNLPTDREVTNRVNVLEKVDVRGIGGYVVLPPSPHVSGGMYEIVDRRAVILDAPLALLELVVEPPKKRRAQPQSAPLLLPAQPNPDADRKRFMGMVVASARRIREAPSGTRNDTVVRECFGIGGFAATLGIAPEAFAVELTSAAEAADQPVDTVYRSLEAGAAQPRPMPPDQPLLQGANRGPATDTRFVRIDDTQPDMDVIAGLGVRKNKDTGAITVLATLPNAILILDRDRRWKNRVRFCEFRQRVELDGRVVSDADEGEIVVWVDRVYGVTLKTTTVHEALVTVAARHPQHPIREFLLGIEWDGTARLDNWLVTYAGVDEDPIGYGAKFCISAVARILKPGCQVDQVLVLSDPKQGQGKTSLVRTLAGLDYASETQLHIGDKDAYIQLQGVWIYELGELASLKRSDIEAVKGFVTARVDKYRPPYGRNTVEQPRQCVFIGTTNELQFLPEGGRRWWIRRVVGPADLAALERDRGQLWAEAVHRFRVGEPWHLTGRSAEQQREDADSYVQRDPWEDAIAALVADSWVAITVQMVLDKIGIPFERRGRSEEIRVGKILASLGLSPRKEYRAGERRHWWTRR